MNVPILRLDHINITIGGTNLLQDICLSVSKGERICLVGRNGSGKSTLLQIISGLLEPQSGKVFCSSAARLGYIEQNPDLSDFSTISEYIEHTINDKTDCSYSLTSLLKKFNFTGNEKIAHLSVGQARCVSFIRTLILRPDIIILDEPTNHLDFRTIHWLEQELLNINSTLIFVSHDRRFLQTLSTTTIWLDRGCVHRLNKGFSHFEPWRDQILEQEKKDYDHLKEKKKAEEEWLRYGVTARRKRNVRRVKELHVIRTQLHERKQSFHGTMQTPLQSTQSSGRLVIEVNQITKAYQGRSVVQDFSLRIRYGERIGIIGPNGAGKTTLLKLLTGELTPDSGSVTLGTNLHMSIIDQQRTNINPNETLASYLTGGSGDHLVAQGVSRHVMGYIKDFLFQADQAHSLIKDLSGGERMRAILARVLSQPCNFLLMDEPTNDLDFETLDFLEETLSHFQGTILIISHDRDFLDRTVTSTLAANNINHPDGYWTKYAGGYSDMIAQQKQSAPTVPKKHGHEISISISKKTIKNKKSLSYGQKLLLESLPQTIQDIHHKITENENKMNDKTLFLHNEKEFYRLSNELKNLYQESKEKEEEWLKLSLLQEEAIKNSEE
ncbi:MAG: ABC transporter ATP-binding protein [Candidatus Liberibacter ctenarytainae]|uniref:ABC transporter ATP-binding protein n=1 Tax=Candidatus Liberibacter ctenarytainae TaxID=2020335 RepID=A0A937AQM2_9HYPH|nr:ABC transporter ATP-binding protein [Candidatus Liberibacter ctenarytainae]